MFGITPPPQNENSQFNPQSPYGISKVAAFYTTKYFRQAQKCLLQMEFYLTMNLQGEV